VPSYRVMLDVPREPDLIRFWSARRSPTLGRNQEKTRKPGCYRQAVFGPAWFRHNGSIPLRGTGSGLSQAMSYQYIDVLAEQAPDCGGTSEKALGEGAPYVFLDGKIVGCERCHEKTVSRKGKEIDLWYSGRRRTSAGTSRPFSARWQAEVGL
jgi:hypothetical protein